MREAKRQFFRSVHKMNSRRGYFLSSNALPHNVDNADIHKKYGSKIMWKTWITVFGIAFVFITNALGAAVVFFFKKDIPPKLNRFLLGFASGVMIAASVWSLLLPSIEQSESLLGGWAFLPACVGILLGGVFLTGLDRLAPYFMQNGKNGNIDGRGAWRSWWRVFSAVTLHNVPEGLAVGFAFGAAARSGSTPAFLSALGLAIGIGIQNFPEGAAVALPVKSACGSNRKAFLWGAASGVAEPIFAIIGYFLAASLALAQPWLLAFAAGAMLFVAAEDLIPEARSEESPSLGAWGVLLGFVVMMSLDVLFG